MYKKRLKSFKDMTAHDVAMQDPAHNVLSTPMAQNNYPNRLMPPSPAGWGDSLGNNPIQPEY